MSRNIFIGLGSNVGDRLAFLDSAVRELGELGRTKVVRASSVYETEPYGEKNQAEFLNMVVEIESELEPDELLEEIKHFERKLGRRQTERWGPREIDLDILYFGNTVLNGGALRIPHPEVVRRRFVLAPLNEIAPSFVDPVRGQNVSELLRACGDTCRVRKMEFTTGLQEH